MTPTTAFSRSPAMRSSPMGFSNYTPTGYGSTCTITVSGTNTLMDMSYNDVGIRMIVSTNAHRKAWTGNVNLNDGGEHLRRRDAPRGRYACVYGRSRSPGEQCARVQRGGTSLRREQGPGDFPEIRISKSPRFISREHGYAMHPMELYCTALDRVKANMVE